MRSGTCSTSATWCRPTSLSSRAGWWARPTTSRRGKGSRSATCSSGSRSWPAGGGSPNTIRRSGGGPIFSTSWATRRSSMRRLDGRRRFLSIGRSRIFSMPKRTDLSSILLIGSGPIIIGQGAGFDYSRPQAAGAPREGGCGVILWNANPATIMTDPEVADRTYVEPIPPEWVERIIERERPDALLPTMGGQTALNVAMALTRSGTLAKYGVELIGANERAIRIAEDRSEFARAMRRIGLATPPGVTVTSVPQGLDAVEATGYPAILRPSFTLGGTGGSPEFEEGLRRGLEL